MLPLVVSRFLSVVAVCVVAGVSCCRVVGLVAVLVLLGFGWLCPVLLQILGLWLGFGLVLWPVSLRLLFRC